MEPWQNLHIDFGNIDFESPIARGVKEGYDGEGSYGSGHFEIAGGERSTRYGMKSI